MILTHPVLAELREQPGFEALRATIEFPELEPYEGAEELLTEEISIQSDTREKLHLDVSKLLFIEAQDNYCNFVWRDGEETREKLLRITLKGVEEQLEHPALVRCHRSFMINARASFQVLGNSNGYKLKTSAHTTEIPVSRSKGREILDLLT